MPSYGDIQFLMQEANKITGRWVELPYSGKDKKLEFILAVKYDGRTEDPAWTLFQVTGAGQSTLWNYSSRDLALVVNLILTSSGADQIEEYMTAEPGSMMAGKTKEHSSATSTSTTLKTVSTSGSGIVFEPPRQGAKATLEGDLKNLQVPNLLQSINLAKMTGKLDVRSKTESAEVYFQDGIPLHAAIKDTKGDAALIELITWTLGEFRFCRMKRRRRKPSLNGWIRRLWKASPCSTRAII